MEISKESLKEIKLDLFNKNISEEEKKEIINKINEEIDKLLKELEESEPIDE